ncbi:MAG TPA: class I SAM-dependent methyltransferase [Gaiellaceae bacterium]|nr:class I SAM-dependent methyltransferase [Gaiellaceae bacterium]
MTMDNPVAVREQYATEENLKARQRLWANLEGENARLVLFRILSELQPRNVLEVGGGQGELAERMQRELGAAVTFVDQSERMVELARARGMADAQVGDVQELPFEDGRFDTVVAAWMLYHVQDLDRGLAEIARVLEPGGSLVAVTNSVRHLEELQTIFDTLMRGYEDRFNSENGEASLRRHFSTVERTDANVIAVVDEHDVLEGYRRSLLYETRPLPADLELPFRVHGRTTIFVATK